VNFLGSCSVVISLTLSLCRGAKAGVG
jgi:hypothetical protein